MIRKIILVVALIAIAMVPDVVAGERFELTPIIGYRFGGDFDDINDPSSSVSSVDVGDSQAYGLLFDINMGADTEIEVSWSRQDTDLTAKLKDGTKEDLSDTTIDYWHVGGNWLFGDSTDSSRGFVNFSLGATHISPDAFSGETQFSFGIGGGGKFFFSETIGVRLQGRLLTTYINSSTEWWCAYGCWAVESGNYLLQAEVDAGLIFRF